MGELNFNVIAAIRELSSEIASNGFSETKFVELHEKTERMNAYFGTSDRQTWIMIAVIIRQMSDYDVCLRDLVTFFGMENDYMLELKIDIDQLVEKRLLIADRSRRGRRIFRAGNYSFSTSENVLDAVFKNLPLEECTAMKNLDLFGFCDEVASLIQNRSEDMMTSDDLCESVQLMETRNPDIKMVAELQRMRFETEERVLLYEMMNDFISGSRSTTLGMTLKDMIESKKQCIRMMDDFISSRSELIKKGIVSVEKYNFGNDIAITFTPYAMDLFAAEELGSLLKNNRMKVLMPPCEIKEKQLYFYEKLNNQLNFLQKSLLQVNFSAMQLRLTNQGFNQGVAALFYGAPGTGKTESVLQLAKSTGRAIYRVDISESKSMWYGESQKKIKEIFNTYRMACQHSEIKPILLFNEADALFSARKRNPNSSVDQTENAIQNILLEEMETLDGILIATTNLADNLDNAFDRRFLFKIEFDKPDHTAKRNIWLSKLDWLNDEQLDTLANRFDFSGGEIDNVVRKVLMNQVLTGNLPALEELIHYCETERLSNHTANRTKIGF